MKKSKLVVIYNVFDGEELLPYSVKEIKPHVDAIICVYQNVSNRGEQYQPTFKHSLFDYVIEYVPNLKMTASANEKRKRNFALSSAKELVSDMTHFVFLDCDEIYSSDDFKKAKEEVISTGVDASFCNMLTYYRKPTLVLNPPETYFVPFICKYFSWQTLGKNDYLWNKGIISDPTRTPIAVATYRLLQIRMNHYSFVRADIGRKLRNSSSDLYAGKWQELKTDFEAGKLIHFKGHELIESKNLFNIEL